MPPTKTRAALSKMNKEQLIGAFQDLQSELKSLPAIPPAIAAEVATKAKEVVTAAKPLTVEALVSNAGQFELAFRNTIKSLTDKAIEKASELETLQAAVELADQDMEKRYNLEVAKASVDMLLGDYEARAAELEAGIKARQDNWAAENDVLTKTYAARKTELEAARSREQADYDYKTRTERARAEESFKYDLEIQKRNQAVQVAEFNANVEKIKAFHSAEAQKLDEEKARVAELEAGIEKRIADAVADKVTSAVTGANIKFALEKKDMENANALLRQQLTDANSQISRLLQENGHLNVALDKARGEVSTVAANAFAAVNGQTALKAVQENIQATSAPSARRQAA